MRINRIETHLLTKLSWFIIVLIETIENTNTLKQLGLEKYSTIMHMAIALC